jgi:hypothetical protein
MISPGCELLATMGSPGRRRRFPETEFKIREVTQREVHGTAWDLPKNCHVPMVIDLATGTHRGGASPELLVCRGQPAKYREHRREARS